LGRRSAVTGASTSRWPTSAASLSTSAPGTNDISGSIDGVNIADTATAGTQPGLELDTTSGTFAVSNFTVGTNGATGVRLNNAGTVTFAPTETISITSTTCRGP
jgi:hypothetical protein